MSAEQVPRGNAITFEEGLDRLTALLRDDIVEMSEAQAFLLRLQSRPRRSVDPARELAAFVAEIEQRELERERRSGLYRREVRRIFRAGENVRAFVFYEAGASPASLRRLAQEAAGVEVDEDEAAELIRREGDWAYDKLLKAYTAERADTETCRDRWCVGGDFQDLRQATRAYVEAGGRGASLGLAQAAGVHAENIRRIVGEPRRRRINVDVADRVRDALRDLGAWSFDS